MVWETSPGDINILLVKVGTRNANDARAEAQSKNVKISNDRCLDDYLRTIL